MESVINEFPSGGTAELLSGDLNQTTIIIVAVLAVLSACMCILGLKLVRVWNILIGLVFWIAAGGIIIQMTGMDAGTYGIIVLVASLVLAILGGILKRFGAFVLSLCIISMLVAANFVPTATELWIALIICGAAGLVVGILTIIFYEPMTILVTALGGGMFLGAAIATLAGIENAIMVYAMGAVFVLLGIGVQFAIRSREISKKEVKNANRIKEEISKESEIEQARSILEADDMEDDE